VTHTLTTGPLDPAAKKSIEAGIHDRYEEAGLVRPGVVEWVASPLAGADTARGRAAATEKDRDDAAARFPSLAWLRARRPGLIPGKVAWQREERGLTALAQTAELITDAGEPTTTAVSDAINAALSDWRRPAPLHTDSATVCWWPHPEFVIISEPPVEVHTRDGLPHHRDEPAVLWSDGWSLDFWRGLHIPRRLPERSYFAVPGQVRHAISERMGWDAHVKQMNMKAFARTDDPAGSGELILFIQLGIGETVSLATLDGAGRVHVADLPDELEENRDPVVAAAWEYGVPVEVYRRSRRDGDDLTDQVTGETHHRNRSGTAYLFEVD
jgi:hypothetical protein